MWPTWTMRNVEDLDGVGVSKKTLKDSILIQLSIILITITLGLSIYSLTIMYVIGSLNKHKLQAFNWLFEYLTRLHAYL